MTDDLEEFAKVQNQFVAAVADIYDTLKAAHLPDTVCEAVTIAWAQANLEGEEADDDE